MRLEYVIEPVIDWVASIVCTVIAPRLSAPHSAAFLVEKDAQQRILERLDVGIALRFLLR